MSNNNKTTDNNWSQSPLVVNSVKFHLTSFIDNLFCFYKRNCVEVRIIVSTSSYTSLTISEKETSSVTTPVWVSLYQLWKGIMIYSHYFVL